MKLLVTVATVASAQYNPTTVAPPAEEATTVAPTCAPGWTFNNDNVCVQDLPCEQVHTCAYNAQCNAGVESWEYECVCDSAQYYGDGVNVCKTPEGCEPGASGADCNCSSVYVGAEWSNITASWNDTDTCYYEIQVAANSAKVGSWQLNAGFDQDVSLLAVWNAVQDVDNSSTDEIIFRPQSWNMNQQSGFNFHVTTPNYDSGCPLEQAPTVKVCNSVFVSDTEEPTPIDDKYNNADECLDMTVSQYNVWEAGASFKQSVVLSVDLEKNVKEWHVSIAVNDTLGFNSIHVWNMQFDPVSNALTAEDYNANLWAGTTTWSGELDLNVENVELTASICYQKYE